MLSTVSDDLVRSIEQANARFADSYDGPGLTAAPRGRTAVLACMDSRLPVEAALGLRLGDAHVVRNAGGRVDAGALRSLVLSNAALGTRRYVVVHHTGCGLEGFDEAAFHARLPSTAGISFLPFEDVETSVVEDCRALLDGLRDAGLEVESVLGYVYDVATGCLRRVV